MKERVVEMFIGVGSDCGTWDTDYVAIPEDTPIDKIEEVAKNKLHEIGVKFTICGVYCIPPLDDEINEL